MAVEIMDVRTLYQGWSKLSLASVRMEEGRTVERLIEEGRQIVTSKLPAVISVLKDINEPRYPNFIGIRKASKAVIPVWSSADLDLGESASGAAANTQTAAYRNLPVRVGSVEIIDGATEQEKAEKLIAKLIEEKIL